jgi:hypothetical protein
VAAWALWRDSSALVNAGFLWAAVLLAVVAAISYTSGWRMHVDEKEALVKAQQALGFPVGHASAQQVWRGIRSRPTWRVLCYSTEDPPERRGLVLVDAVDGEVLEHLVEDNPERWNAAPPVATPTERTEAAGPTDTAGTEPATADRDGGTAGGDPDPS